MASVRSGGWTATGFAFAAAQRMMGDGTVAELTRLKRLDARPIATLSLEAQERHERREKVFRED